VRRVRLGAARDADPLELRRGFEEGLRLEPPRHPHLRRGELHHLAFGIDDQEREPHLARLVVRSPVDDGDVVPGRAPELLERLPAADDGLRRFLSLAGAAARRAREGDQRDRDR
jgi:hypothetical protein